MNRTDLITTVLKTPGIIAPDESEKVQTSLSKNGIAVVNGFLSVATLAKLGREASIALSPEHDPSAVLGAKLSTVRTNITAEFRHPFVISASAVELVTQPSLVQVIERYLGKPAIIHHALFQESYPIAKPAVDWHVDTGSNKAMNGIIRIRDRRLRMIVYLTDVQTGGLGYILDSRDAANKFIEMPKGKLFPQNEVPLESSRRVTVSGPAGTLILFDAHGLHRPEPPQQNRTVLNVWFARNDFSASLPPVLVSLPHLYESNTSKLYIFNNVRGFNMEKYKKPPESSLVAFLKYIILKLSKKG